MGFFGAAIGAITGALPDVVGRVIDEVLPDKESPEAKEQKARLELELTKAVHAHELAILQAANDADQEFNRRTESLEGTAKDLILLGVVGKVILAVRSAIRPGITICTCIWDWMVFSGKWATPYSTELFFLLNGVVVCFWFGERAIANAAPALGQFVKHRAEAKFIRENGPTT